MTGTARRRADVEDDDLPDGVEDLPRMSFEQLVSYGWDCVDLERGIYESPLGDYYRSPYRRPAGDG